MLKLSQHKLLKILTATFAPQPGKPLAFGTGQSLPRGLRPLRNGHQLSTYE